MQTNDDGSTTYTQEDLEKMSQEERDTVFMCKVKLEGKGVVRGADGEIKYDADAVPGEYGEEIAA